MTVKSDDLYNAYDTIIVGGGLAGLVNAILLSKAGKRVLLIEKKAYPFHKVCGEYVSNEVLNFLVSIGFDPFYYGASSIKKLRISSPQGKNIYADLPLGGFGISRNTMDESLSKIALRNGAEILNAKVSEIKYHENKFTITTEEGYLFNSALVIGSYGKRDSLDKKLKREFIQSRTNYLGVKYHVKTDYPIDEVGLDNFEGGYCGIVKIENDLYNLCYLYKRNSQFKFKSLNELEEKILFKNPVLKNMFEQSNFIPDSHETINEISFAPKQPVENHILMCGDSAGLITPLCGNGMSMAIHGAKLLSELIIKSKVLSETMVSDKARLILEQEYTKQWKFQFSSRLFWGRTIQHFFGNNTATNIALKTIHAFPFAEKWLIKNTHGKPIQ